MSSKNVLINKYRPSTLDKILGQDAIVKSIDSLFNKSTLPHSFMFVGNPGSGKTSLSRIIAQMLKCNSENIIEIDAAQQTGVEDMRDLKDNLKYGMIGQSSLKFVIIDECASLSSNSWQSLLKTVEEPPSHVYFSFCTSNPTKVPEAIKQRCIVYNLKPVDEDLIFKHIKEIAKLEGIKLTDDLLGIIATEAKGSPRQALTYLTQAQDCSSKEELAQLIESVCIENIDVREICQLLLKKTISSQQLLPLLKRLKEAVGLTPEGCRIQILNYLTACVLNPKSDTYLIASRMKHFLKPIYDNAGFGALCFYVLAASVEE